MLKKFSFWVFLVLVAVIGVQVLIHQMTLQTVYQKTTQIQPLYQRQKVIDSMGFELERYRRLSSSFRKLEPGQIAQLKENLRDHFVKNTEKLDRLQASLEEKNYQHQLTSGIDELLLLAAKFEPMLFTKDAYQKPDVQSVHSQLVETLAQLQKLNEHRIESLKFEPPQLGSRSVMLLLSMGALILALVMVLMIKNFFTLVRPLGRLFDYSQAIRTNQNVHEKAPQLTGKFAEIRKTIDQLAKDLQNHVKDRHKFIQDIVADLKAPLALLQSGQFMLGGAKEAVSEQKKAEVSELVVRGLALISGSLDDLNDIININRLETNLEEKTVDVSEMISDLSRKLLGPDASRRIKIQVPPMPVWMKIDSIRFERVFLQLISKILGTIRPGGSLTVSVAESSHAGFRGVEIIVQESERLKEGRAIPTGPEQDLLKHWISDQGLSMALAHKIIKAHGGSVTAAGVPGTSVAVFVRLPHERVVARGLISPPTEDKATEVRGLVTHKEDVKVSPDSLVLR